MDKRSAHKTYNNLRHINPWYVFVIFLILASFSVYQLRHNNLEMAQLRDAVYVADQNNDNVDESLQQLRSYVGHHMNTNLSSGENAVYPPIQLKYTYDRLITSKSSQTNDRNARIYTQAQAYCEDKIPSGFSGRYRIGCIQDYVKSHNASPTYISPDLYKFDFYSPVWAPDWAGLSLIAASLSLVLLVALLANRWIMRQLSRD